MNATHALAEIVQEPISKLNDRSSAKLNAAVHEHVSMKYRNVLKTQMEDQRRMKVGQRQKIMFL